MPEKEKMGTSQVNINNNRNNFDDGVLEIDILALLKAVWHNLLAVIVVAELCAVLAFVGTFLFVQPKYQASTMMYVNNSSFSFGATNFSISTGELSAASSLVDTYRVILESRTTLEDVIDVAELNYSYEALKGMISTSNVSDTGVFSITVTSSNPMEAEQIANTIASILPDRIAEIVDGSSVRIVDYAIVPAHRSSPSYVKNTAVGFLLGAVLSIGVICVLEIILSRLDVEIHSVDELAEKYPNIPILAIIPDIRKASKNGYYYSTYYATDDKKGKKKEVS